MLIRAADLLSKVSSKVLLEVLPVATASVLGTIVINHYARQPSPAPIIVQLPPLPTEGGALQSLHEEHDTLVDHKQGDSDLQAKRQSADAVQIASTDGDSPPLPPGLGVRRAAPPRAGAAPEKVAIRPKLAAKKKITPVDPEPRVVVAPLPAIDPSPMIEHSPALEFSYLVKLPVAPVTAHALYGVRPIMRVASVMRDWVGDLAALPGRALVLTRFSDSPPPPASAGPDLLRPY